MGEILLHDLNPQDVFYSEPPLSSELYRSTITPSEYLASCWVRIDPSTLGVFPRPYQWCFTTLLGVLSGCKSANRNLHFVLAEEDNCMRQKF
ncbi:MAG: hypothetical protein V3T32_08010 [Thermodesulfobacteriota bacterium]